MTPTKQTIIGSKGNCFQACIATILDLDLSDVPDLNAYEENGEWMGVLNEWLAARKLAYFEAEIPFGEIDAFFEDKDFYHIIIGPTKQGGKIHHAVVARKGKVVFDPMPGGLELARRDRLRFGMFVVSGI